MQKLTSKSFEFTKNILYFFKILVIFSILMLLFEWVEHLLNTNWTWLNFIRPLLNSILNFSESINKNSINLLGAIFEFKYGIALIIFTIIYYAINGLIFLNSFLEKIVTNTQTLCRKIEEEKFNKSLQEDINKKQRQIKNFSIAIKTKAKQKYKYEEINVDINEQNLLMNKYIMEKLSVIPKEFNGGFLYEFHDFNQIDSVLEIMFKVLKSTAPIEYAICVQINNNYTLLEKLMSLDYYGKIIMLSETSYRYEFNPIHKYESTQIGIFQNDNQTMEIHEFKEIM